MEASDEWNILLTEDKITSKVSEMAGIIKSRLAGRDVVLCAILKGATYFAVDLSRKLDAIQFNHSVYFVEASSYTGMTQNSTGVELLLSSRLIPEKFKDKTILLVDELFDNGLTMHTIREYLVSTLDIDESTIVTCVAFRKEKKTKYRIPDIIGFDALPDVWYIGYGLDDNGKLRGLTDLWAKTKLK